MQSVELFCAYDMTSGLPEKGYINIDLQLYIEQTFPSDAQKYIVNHIIETASTRFTAEDLAFGNVTRYEINKVIDQLRKDFK